MTVQLIVKAAEVPPAEAAERIREQVAESLVPATCEHVSVSQVFPGLTSGQRARLFAVELPGDLSPEQVSKVLSELRDHPQVEYAELPSPRRAQ